jgi:hypothetical protein
MYFYSEYYDITIREFLEEEKKHRKSKFTPTDLQFKLNVFSFYNNSEPDFNLYTTLGTMVNRYLNNPDSIDLCLSYYLNRE